MWYTVEAVVRLLLVIKSDNGECNGNAFPVFVMSASNQNVVCHAFGRIVLVSLAVIAQYRGSTELNSHRRHRTSF